MSDLARVDAHALTQDDYDELPEINEEALCKGSTDTTAPSPTNPRKLEKFASIRLPVDVVRRWKRRAPVGKQNG
jgi:uncharacterized protein (DUF4415 family)